MATLHSSLRLRRPHRSSGGRSRIVAVDCGASRVACGLFSRGARGRLRLERLAVRPLDCNPAAGLDWPADLAKAMDSLSGETWLRGPCRVALPGHITLTKCVSVPATTAPATGEWCVAEAEQNIPCSLDRVVWDHLLLSDEGADRDVLLAAAKVEMIGAVHAAVAGAGLSVEMITPAAAGLVRSWRRCPSEEETTLVVDLGARSTQLALIADRRFLVRTLPFGGNLVTRHLADHLGLDFPVAEQLKRQLAAALCFGAESDRSEADAFRRAVEHLVQRLHGELGRTMAGRSWPRSGLAAPAGVRLTGGGSLLPGLQAEVTRQFGVSARAFDPLEAVELADPSLGRSEAAAGLASLVGLAAAEEDGAGMPALLPGASAREAGRRRRVPALATAMTCAVLAPLPLVGHDWRAFVVAEEDISRIDERLAPLEIAAGRRIQAGKLLAAERQSVEELAGLLGRRTSWARFLADLEARFAEVDHVWLDRMQLVAIPLGGPRPKDPLATRLRLGGRMLDTANPGSLPGPAAFRQADALLRSIGESPFVEAIESENLDNGEPGILRFECVVRLKQGEL